MSPEQQTQGNDHDQPIQGKQISSQEKISSKTCPDAKRCLGRLIVRAMGKAAIPIPLGKEAFEKYSEKTQNTIQMKMISGNPYNYLAAGTIKVGEVTISYDAMMIDRMGTPVASSFIIRNEKEGITITMHENNMEMRAKRAHPITEEDLLQQLNNLNLQLSSEIAKKSGAVESNTKKTIDNINTALWTHEDSFL